MQPLQDFVERELVFQIQFVIEIGPDAVLMTLPVLRHHDDGRLQSGDDVEGKIKQDEREWIELLSREQEGIDDDPKAEKGERDDDEFPTAAESRDRARRAIGKGEGAFFFFVNVARDPALKKLVRRTEAIRQRGEHAEGDVRVILEEGKEMSP